MSISLEFINTSKYLKVKIKGIWTTSNALETLEKIRKEADQQNFKRILLDLLDLSSPESELTRFQTGEKIATTFEHTFKIAGFAQNEKINRFAESVAVNRGANFNMFYNENDAIEWLQY